MQLCCSDSQSNFLCSNITFVFHYGSVKHPPTGCLGKKLKETVDNYLLVKNCEQEKCQIFLSEHRENRYQFAQVHITSISQRCFRLCLLTKPPKSLLAQAQGKIIS